MGSRIRSHSLANALLVVSALSALQPGTIAAQGGRIRVSYDVELSVQGSALSNYCPGTGTDVLVGTLVGVEPALKEDDNEYVGNLSRSTRFSVCDVKRQANGEDAICNLDIAGNGFVDVVLTVYWDGRGGWLQYVTNRATYAALMPPPHVGPQNSTVTGTCDPADMAQMQTDYPNGQTAGSPNGQRIEVPGLPPASYPFTFAAKLPNSIWTLKVLARRP